MFVEYPNARKGLSHQIDDGNTERDEGAEALRVGRGIWAGNSQNSKSRGDWHYWSFFKVIRVSVSGWIFFPLFKRRNETRFFLQLKVLKKSAYYGALSYVFFCLSPFLVALSSFITCVFYFFTFCIESLRDKLGRNFSRYGFRDYNVCILQIRTYGREKCPHPAKSIRGDVAYQHSQSSHDHDVTRSYGHCSGMVFFLVPLFCFFECP